MAKGDSGKDLIFGKYAEYYDVIYSNKDYDAEVFYLDEILGRFGRPNSILDLGCGTGEHMIRLKEFGYTVSGIDLSKGMIAQARKKGLSTWVADMREFHLGSRFGCCICMFGGIGYLNNIHDFARTLECVGEHLKSNGLFIFDYWNGLAVLTQMPEVRNKRIDMDDLVLLRIARPKLKIDEQICEVRYTCSVKRGDQCVDEFEEIHRLRFYFPGEIRLALSTAGFDHLVTYPFMMHEGVPDGKSWNVITVARWMA